MLENKMFDNVSGATEAEKELKTQRIRKALETFNKEQKLHGEVVPAKSRPPKSKARTSLAFGHKKFGPKFIAGYKHGGYNGHAGMTAAVDGQRGQAGYVRGYGGDGGRSYRRGGLGGYGTRGGSKPARTCHRSVPCL